MPAGLVPAASPMSERRRTRSTGATQSVSCNGPAWYTSRAAQLQAETVSIALLDSVQPDGLCDLNNHCMMMAHAGGPASDTFHAGDGLGHLSST